MSTEPGPNPPSVGGPSGRPRADPRAAVLIALPKGAALSGITTWAASLARAMSARGRCVMLLVHATREAPTLGPLAELTGERVECRLLRAAPGIDESLPEPRPELPAYAQAVRDLSDDGRQPVVAVPTLSAECAGLLAAASREVPGVLRAVGWMHSDIPYDLHTLRHYERLMHRFVAVSAEIESKLRAALPGRAADVRRIPYGVAVPDAPPARAPWGRRPLRIVSTGRMDREQKRVHAMIDMSRELTRRGVDHELTLVGEGPLSREIDEACAASSGRVRRVSAEPDQVGPWLERADVFTLASRYEGLSVAMLEAMARGAVPVVTRVSGASDAVEARAGGACGVVVQASDAVDDPALGPALAEGVLHAVETGLPALSGRAHAQARRCFSIETLADAFDALCDEAAREPARGWGDAPTSAGDFTVPHDAAERFRAALAAVPPGARIALWGAGRHTRRLLEDVPEARRRIVALIDDSPPAPTTHGLPTATPARAADLGVTDVILSSALHEDALWSRRGEIERHGPRVHRLYPCPPALTHQA